MEFLQKILAVPFSFELCLSTTKKDNQTRSGTFPEHAVKVPTKIANGADSTPAHRALYTSLTSFQNQTIVDKYDRQSL